MSYRKRIKLAKGIHLNLSGSGIGLGFSPMKGLSFSMNKDGIYSNASLSGTGLYKRAKMASFSDSNKKPASTGNYSNTDKVHYEVTMQVDGEGKIQTCILGNGVEITDDEELRRLKRRDDIKAAISKLQYMMKDKVDDADAEFIEIYKHTENPALEETVRAKMNKLKYEPEIPVPFSEVEPDEASVRSFLEQEAKERISSILFWTVAKKRQAYVDSNLANTLNEQHIKWENDKTEYETAELERITGINYSKKFDYDTQMAVYETYFNGDEEAVSAQMETMLAALELPCDFSLDYDIDLSTGTARFNLYLPEIEDIPSKKANILASGKVSVKEKTKKELASDYATCTTGLAFFFAGMMFNVSSRVNIIEVSGYTQRIDPKTGERTDQYIYVVRFDRERFRGLKFSGIIPYESFEIFPHVMDLTKQMIFKTINPSKINDN